MAWIRKGECNRCGDCCKSGNPFERLQEVLDKPTVAGLYDNHACPLFKYEEVGGKQLGTCMLKSGEKTNLPSEVYAYHTVACTPWPEHPSNIENYPNCSYTFEWVD